MSSNDKFLTDMATIQFRVEALIDDYCRLAAKIEDVDPDHVKQRLNDDFKNKVNEFNQRLKADLGKLGTPGFSK